MYCASNWTLRFVSINYILSINPTDKYIEKSRMERGWYLVEIMAS